MAEQGWATKHELIEIEFDERVIKDLILILKNLLFFGVNDG